MTSAEDCAANGRHIYFQSDHEHAGCPVHAAVTCATGNHTNCELVHSGCECGCHTIADRQHREAIGRSYAREIEDRALLAAHPARAEDGETGCYGYPRCDKAQAMSGLDTTDHEGPCSCRCGSRCDEPRPSCAWCGEYAAPAPVADQQPTEDEANRQVRTSDWVTPVTPPVAVADVASSPAPTSGTEGLTEAVTGVLAEIAREQAGSPVAPGCPAAADRAFWLRVADEVPPLVAERVVALLGGSL